MQKRYEAPAGRTINLQPTRDVLLNRSYTWTLNTRREEVPLDADTGWDTLSADDTDDAE